MLRQGRFHVRRGEARSEIRSADGRARFSPLRARDLAAGAAPYHSTSRSNFSIAVSLTFISEKSAWTAAIDAPRRAAEKYFMPNARRMVARTRIVTNRNGCACSAIRGSFANPAVSTGDLEI